MLRLPLPILDRIVAHARAEVPVEACGLLAGRDDTVERHFRMTNADRSAEHFTLDPREQFAAARAIRTAGLKTLAVYHSHPASPARPSAEDIRLALDPSVLHVIVSLAGAQPEAAAFRIREGAVELEPIEIASGSAFDGAYDEFAVAGARS